MRKLFGTDGVRGYANRYPITPDVVLKLAQAAGQKFTRGDHRHLVVIGKDTRLSGYMIEPALTSGFVSMGMDVVLLGPMPTPAVAMLTRSLRADLGVMISASHNPYHDNGIKLFGPDGFKLSDDEEIEIETLMQQLDENHLATSDHLGRARRLDDAQGRYIEFSKNTFPRGMRLDGLKIVLDCAHGAAYKVAPTVLWELGADIITMGVSPDGLNINNDVGATSLAALQMRVVSEGAHLGIALDGDADRVVFVDEKGAVIDGDQIMTLIASDWHMAQRLSSKHVVATVMSNLGMEYYLKDLGLDLLRAPVGDRYVLEMMKQFGANMGGEQSGHIILSDYSTTGDGLIAALQVLSVIVRRQKNVSDVCHVFEKMPQVLRNVRLQSKESCDVSQIKSVIREAESILGERGHVLVRKSGTEPLIRIMAQGDDEELVNRSVNLIEQALKKAG